MVLSSAQWSSCVVGRVSPWIAVDSLDASVAHASEVALKQELAWATHLTVPAALLPAMGPRNASLARCISQVLVQAPSIKVAHCASARTAALTHASSHSCPYMGQVWVTVPLTCGEGDGDSWKARGSRHAGLCLVSHGYAQWWSRLHSLCEWHPSMGVTLEMSGDVPPDGTIERWLAEPVKVRTSDTAPSYLSPHALALAGGDPAHIFVLVQRQALPRLDAAPPAAREDPHLGVGQLAMRHHAPRCPCIRLTARLHARSATCNS